MYWICEWLDEHEGIQYVLGRNDKFLLFKRKKNAIAYLDENDANFEPRITKVSLEEAKKLFGKYEYEII